MPSRWAIAGLATIILGFGTSALFLVGPLVPVTNFVLQRQNQFDLALAVLNNGLYVNPMDSRLLFQRALTLQKLGRIEEALADDNTLIARPGLSTSELADAYAMRGDIFGTRGKPTKALDSLKEASRLDKNSATSFHQRAYQNLRYESDPAEAARLETIALTIDANLPKSYLNRSNAYSHLGQDQKAVEDCTTALSLKVDWNRLPRHLRQELLNNRSDAHYGLNDLSNAVKDAEEACAETRKSSGRT